MGGTQVDARFFSRFFARVVKCAIFKGVLRKVVLIVMVFCGDVVVNCW